MTSRDLLPFLAAALLALAGPPLVAGDGQPSKKKIVLIAGKKSHGPVGNGIHDYGWSVRLLKVMLDHSNVKDQVVVEYHLDGWPRDPKTLEDAATILIVSDGRDGNLYEEAPYLASPERVRDFDRLMKKGCGFLTFHFSTFAPDAYAEQVLRWCGGYFDWETDGTRQWYSAITTTEAEVRPGAPEHPISRGLKPFTMREEFYYNIRFRPKDATLQPIWVVPALKGREPDGKVVAWAREREDGGRGFGTTCGHFYDNWKHDGFRRMILNALVWTAKGEVPKNGVEARFYSHEEIDRILGPMPGQKTPDSPLGEGRFGKALDTRAAVAIVPGKAEYRDPPITVECWARLLDRGTYNILVASDTKASAAHWEIFTENGKLTVYVPGRAPDHVRSNYDIVDGKWYYIAMIFEPQRLRLFVDGKPVADQVVRSKGGTVRPGDLALGAIVERTIGCNGFLDEVRLSQGVREIKGVPDGPFLADERTVGLWRLDGLTAEASGKPVRLEDAARQNHAAVVSPVAAPQGAATPPDGPNYQPADAKLRAVLIDRHPSDVSMAVKADTESRLFVGGREAVFVFEPNARGGYDKGTLLPFPPDSIIIGLELRGNDLYVLTDNALYLVREGRTRRTGLRAERLLWGLPLDLHVSFHCLAWGPEGDLYLNHGDPLLNFGDFPRRPDHWGHWTLYPRPEGTRVPYTGVGAVLRLRPDGSNLRVVSVGYRGPVGLAFDRHWNLFTNDNDHESLAHLYAPARLMHVTPHTDFAWPRGWMASKSPDRADLLEPMTAALGRGVPCGLAYYDEPYLDKEYRQSLLMGRWDRLTVTRYPLLPKGASFTTEELPFLMGENLARPVGVAVGRGGRVFATVLYLPANVGSPHCFSDLVMITRADDAAGHPFEPYDVTTVAAERLWADLSSSSWERRSNAHQELLRRGGTLLGEATRRLAAVRDDDPALMHLPWLAAASGRAEAAPHIAALARHERPEVRVQAIRIITEFSHLKYPHERLAAALADSAPAVQLAALAAFFDAARPLPLNAVVKLARSDDTYLRHTATRLLARRAALKDIAELARSNDPATRLAGVLAAGTRLTVPSSDFVPPESVKLTYTVANAFFTLRFADADKPVDLRAHARTGSYTTAQWWAAITPTAEQKELFELLVRMLEDPESRVRLQAAYWLSLLCDPRSEKRVAAVREAQALRWSAEAPLRQVAQVWAVGPFADSGQGLQPVRPPEEGVIDLTAEYATSAGKRRWQQETGQKGFFDLGLPAASGASVYLYFRLQSVSAQRAVVSLGTDGAARVWHNGSLIRREIPLRRPRLAAVPLDLQPGSNDVLIRLHSSGERQPFELLYQAEKEVVASLPEKLDSAALAQRLREASRGGGAETVPPEFLAIDWPKEAARGNAVQGRKLFGTRGCARCHAVAADQLGGGAPSLADARRRFTVAHLVESVLLPSKQVAEPFRGTVLNLANGLSLSGLVVSETAETVEVLQADATRKTIRKGEIEERSVSQVSPMPAGLVKAPQELRDLLAYLLSENPLPP